MKQVLLVRTDINMSTGKSIAQASHVSVLATRDSNEQVATEWIGSGGKKIVLQVNSDDQLLSILEQVPEDIPTAKIEDLGYTELDSGTLTAGAIGPAEENRIDEYTGDLELYK